MIISFMHCLKLLLKLMKLLYLFNFIYVADFLSFKASLLFLISDKCVVGDVYTY